MSIPKILHQIWLGDNAPEQLLESWKSKYPDYEYKLWTEDNIPKEVVSQRKYQLTHNICQKVNILRYEILHEYGGFYVDSDTYCVKKLPSVYLNDYDFLASYEYESGDVKVPNSDDAFKHFLEALVSNAYMASVPGHPILKLLINTIKTMDEHYYTKEKSWLSSGPGLLTEILKQYKAAVPESKIHIFEKKIF